jgi:hypothetical protein
MDSFTKEKKEKLFRDLVAKITENRRVVNELMISNGKIKIFQAATNFEAIPFVLCKVVETETDFSLFVEKCYSYFYESIDSSKIFSGYIKMIPVLRAYYKHELETQDPNYAEKISTVRSYFKELANTETPSGNEWANMQEKILLNLVWNLDNLIQSEIKKEEILAGSIVQEELPTTNDQNKEAPQEDLKRREIIKKIIVDLNLGGLNEDILNREQFKEILSKLNKDNRAKFIQNILAGLSGAEQSKYFLYNINFLIYEINDEEVQLIANLLYEKVMIIGVYQLYLLQDLDSSCRLKQAFSETQLNKMLSKLFTNGAGSWDAQNKTMILVDYFSEFIFKSESLSNDCFNFIKVVFQDTGYSARAKAKTFLAKNFSKIPEHIKNELIELEVD